MYRATLYIQMELCSHSLKDYLDHRMISTRCVPSWYQD